MTMQTTEKTVKSAEFVEITLADGSKGYILALSPAQAKNYAVKEQIKAVRAGVKTRKLGGAEALRLGLSLENVLDITKVKDEAPAAE